LVTYLEFLGYLSGISWLPIWNFLVTYLEFLGYLSGISWLPIALETLDFTRFFNTCNQVSNQVGNQVGNQAIYQGELLAP
jgi:hypothetical protein